MKIKFPICDLRFPIVPAKLAGSNRRSSSGIALIITLILLSVTLVMAIAFLAISRRESSSVVTAADTAAARLAADSALANAEAQVMANILSTTNPYNFGPLVSTNFINGNGFDPTLGTNNPNNVNYDNVTAASGGGPLSQPDQLQNVANLFYLPRAPVFVPTNSLGSNDFRFYLDLNRNGRFDANGSNAVISPDPAKPFYDTNGNETASFNNVLSNFFTGDPEWIGVLEHPDAPHGPNNHFIARYAFIALPVGNSLDLNAIHNQTLNTSLTVQDGFFRNQGVGSWELNLAAFLTDLNTNIWNPTTDFYNYREPNLFNQGRGFEDALSLLSYRYANNYGSLASASALLNGAPGFNLDNIDGYSDGPLQTNTVNIDESIPANQDVSTQPWAGADNTNHFFTPSDLFDPTKTSVQFTNDLWSAGISNSSYDSYTFYRLLSQLGTDTSPESGRMNLNYVNVDTNGNIVPNMETNFIPWTPLQFFTNAADRMLRAYTANWIGGGTNNFNNFTNTFGASTTNAFGIGNIPVYVNGQFVYTPAVNRILQLAANIYDATVNNRTNGSPDYPDVFRPLFSRDFNGTGTNIYITGFTNVVPFTDGATDPQLLKPVDVATFSVASGVITNVAYNIYGVPWIIGAKKGFPNFNEFSMENNLAVTRRLQLTRTTNSTPGSTPVITGTNQMYTMSLSSSLGVELWNSYSANYPGTVVIGLNETASLTITNDDHGQNLLFTNTFSINPFNNPSNALYSINSWHGTAPVYGGNPYSASFIPLVFNGPSLTNSVYRSSFASGPVLGNPAIAPPGFVYTNNFAGSVPFETNSPNGFYLPQFGLVLTNRLQVFILDLTNGVYHVVDYVHFDGPDSGFNVNANLADPDPVNSFVGVWDTNYQTGSSAPSGPTWGIMNQIAISKSGSVPAEDGLWQSDPEAIGTTAQQEAFFQAFFKPGNRTTTPVAATNLQLSVQAPYSPTRYVVQYLTWQANDPLVHYLASDIDYAQTPVKATTPAPGLNHYNAGQAFSGLTNLNLGFLNDRYMPWGGNPTLTPEQKTQVDAYAYIPSERDPLVSLSDNWDFPTNKLPTVGWLGRVHRGTPWQTVYLKASDILSNGIAVWTNWTGNLNYFDATNSAPVQDRLLFDLFTTSVNDNATRGRLSVNQSGLAAWSALFSGVVALTNDAFTGALTATNIQPAGVYDPAQPPPLVQIWQGINAARSSTNTDGLSGAFEHVGDILRTPQLTEKSPFIYVNPTNMFNGNLSPIYPSDEVMEWLPQQTMSLLRLGTPRYVIYSYGQTLKPAPNSIVTGGGQFFGMVTNYQIVSETATRAVVRFDSTVTNIINNGVSTLTVTNNRAVIESFNILPPD